MAAAAAELIHRKMALRQTSDELLLGFMVEERNTNVRGSGFDLSLISYLGRAASIYVLFLKPGAAYGKEKRSPDCLSVR